MAATGAVALLLGGVVLSGRAPADAACNTDVLPSLFDYSSAQYAQFGGRTLGAGTLDDAALSELSTVVALPGATSPTWTTPTVLQTDGVWGDVRLHGKNLDGASVAVLPEGKVRGAIYLSRELSPGDNSYLEAVTTTQPGSGQDARFSVPANLRADRLAVRVELASDTELEMVEVTYGLSSLGANDVVTVEEGWSGPIVRLVAPNSEEFSGHIGLKTASDIDFARVTTGRDSHVVVDRTEVVQSFGNSVTGTVLDVWLDAKQSATSAAKPFEAHSATVDLNNSLRVTSESAQTDVAPGGPAPTEVAIDASGNGDDDHAAGGAQHREPTANDVGGSDAQGSLELEWRCGPGEDRAQPFTVQIAEPQAL